MWPHTYDHIASSKYVAMALNLQLSEHQLNSKLLVISETQSYPLVFFYFVLVELVELDGSVKHD